MSERVVSSSVSANVVELLLGRGMTLAAIAVAIGATKSFVSRVKSRSRGFTIDHLTALEASLGEPLPLLLLEATPIESVPANLKPLYRSTAKVLGARRAAAKPAKRPRNRVA
jgi:transcriptional regulator with XRE-family HTH domain